MSKLGYFVLDPYDGLIQQLARAKPAMIKAGDPGFLKDVYNSVGPDTTYIARNFSEIDDMARWDNGRILTDPVGAADYWVDAYRPAMQIAPFAYWESFNEMSNFSWMPQYGIFEAERQRLMHLEGFKACIGNFSVGNPPIAPDTNDPWSWFHPALAACHNYKNLLGLHEYGGLYMDLFYGPNQREAMLAGHHISMPDGYDEGWLACRYRKVWRQHIVPNEWTDIQIAITETGLDRAGTDVIDALVGKPVGPWKQCQEYWLNHDRIMDGAAYFAQMMEWYDRQLKADHYVRGCTIFCLGTRSKEWNQFNVQGDVADILDGYILSDGLSNKVVLPSNGLNLRNRPGGVVIGILRQNESVKIIRELVDWSEVQTSEGLVGWCISKWLK